MTASIPARISIVTLGVHDLGRAVSFYESLGWVNSSPQPSIAFFQTADTVLALYPWHELADDATVPQEGSGFRGVTIALNLESPELVDAAVAAWVERGGSLVRAPHKAFWGGYSSYVADLDGHLFEIAHNPYVTFDASGRMQMK
jgi:uncharacterized protein